MKTHISIKVFRLALTALVCVPIAAAQNVAPNAEYKQLARQLASLVQHELKDKGIPAAAIALVDDQQVVWAQGFGWQNDAHTIPATAHTVFRVGSVSKLFTDIGIMQMTEKGTLNLDVPVQQYIPDFSPHNPFRTPITLRQLMSHRSGLLREPPVGNYFDDSGPSLQQTVRSLNKTTLVYAPGTRTKYSNAGVAAAGYVLQTLNHEPYPDYLKKAVLRPLDMRESSFAPEPQLMGALATGYMWSYDGLRFKAPSFQLGEGPCGAMYTTVTDLGKFLSALFNNGKANGVQVVQPKTLQEMWTPQFDAPDATTGFGIGFQLSKFEGHREVGHGGAIYGFSTQLEALPDDKLGVIVVTTLDSTNAVASHIAQEALRGLLLTRARKPSDWIDFNHRLPADLAVRLDGSYANGGETVDLQNQNGDVFLSNLSGGYMVSLRDNLGSISRDGRLGYSPDAILNTMPMPAEIVLNLNGHDYHRKPDLEPAAPPAQWNDLIGEYGWDYDKLYILEKGGRLTALIEWFEFDPLTPVSDSEFQFPEHGLYMGEKATFLRDANGKISAVQVGAVVFPRLHTNADGEVFRIKPLKPVDELRQEALRQRPPIESGYYRDPDLVDVTTLDPTIHLDIRYATTRNFLGVPLYTEARAFLQKPAATALVRASHALNAQGYGLLIHDAYRPWYVTRMFWDATPDDKKIFVADPSQGSRHNRGCAVDLTLYSLATGRPVVMTGGYDEMSERSYPFYPGGTSVQRWKRDLLRRAMESVGFTVFQYEWWHFDYKDWQVYPVMNQTFEQLDKQDK